MEEKHGKFVHGAWVEENEEGNAKEQDQNTDPIEQRIGQVSSMVTTSLHQVISLARDLVTTQEGHAHIEKQVNQAVSEIERAISDVLKRDHDEKSGDSSEEKKKIRLD